MQLDRLGESDNPPEIFYRITDKKNYTIYTSNSLMALNAVGWCWARLMPESPLVAVITEGEMSPEVGPASCTT